MEKVQAGEMSIHAACGSDFPVRLPASVRAESLRASTLRFRSRISAVLTPFDEGIHHAASVLHASASATLALATTANTFCVSKGGFGEFSHSKQLNFLEKVITTLSARNLCEQPSYGRF